jgi:hypothetical protein
MSKNKESYRGFKKPKSKATDSFFDEERDNRKKNKHIKSNRNQMRTIKESGDFN